MKELRKRVDAVVCELNGVDQSQFDLLLDGERDANIIQAALRRERDLALKEAEKAVLIFDPSFGSDVQRFRSRAIDAIRALIKTPGGTRK